MQAAGRGGGGGGERLTARGVWTTWPLGIPEVSKRPRCLRATRTRLPRKEPRWRRWRGPAATTTKEWRWRRKERTERGRKKCMCPAWSRYSPGRSWRWTGPRTACTTSAKQASEGYCEANVILFKMSKLFLDKFANLQTFRKETNHTTEDTSEQMLCDANVSHYH